MEILWRTLVADIFGGTHPAPHPVAKHFFESIWMMIFKELELQRRARRSSTTRTLKHLTKTTILATLGYATNDFDCNPKTAPWGVLMDAEPEDSPHRDEFIHTASRVTDIVARDVGFVGLEGMMAWRREFNVASGRRRLLRMSSGFLGLGPTNMVVGDEVWILAGAKMPFVLRSLENGRYKLLGQAYVHGIMHGEAVEGSDRGEFEKLTLE